MSVTDNDNTDNLRRDFMIMADILLDEVPKIFYGNMRENIRRGRREWPSLTTLTRDTKGSARPLFETGQLRGAIEIRNTARNERRIGVFADGPGRTPSPRIDRRREFFGVPNPNYGRTMSRWIEVTNTQLALIHEFGTRTGNSKLLGGRVNIPPRPFIAPAVDDVIDELFELIDQQVDEIITRNLL